MSMSFAGVAVNSTRGVQLVQPFDLVVPDRYGLVLTGHSGSGKTSLLSAIAGVQGHVLVGELTTTPRFSDSNAIMAVQEPGEAFSPYRKLGKQMLDPVPKDQVPSTAARLDQNLAELGLRTDCRDLYPHEVSGGMLKRLLIAGVCAIQADLRLFDEPFSGLGASHIPLVARMLLKLESPWAASVHDLDFLEMLAPCVVVRMAGGRVVDTRTLYSAVRENNSVEKPRGSLAHD